MTTWPSLALDATNWRDASTLPSGDRFDLWMICAV